MFKMFLDHEKPLHTCINENCNNCDIGSELNCHFNIKQLAKFLLIVFPSFIIAAIFIFKFNPLLFIPWVILILSYFGFVEIRVMCSHCPHYAEPGIKTLKCWANYGSLKIWKYRPGPMSLNEKILFFLGIIIIFAYPIPFFILIKNYIFLGLYIILIVFAKWALNKYFCSYCINFACPLNNVTDEIKTKFFSKNPVVRDAWEK